MVEQKLFYDYAPNSGTNKLYILCVSTYSILLFMILVAFFNPLTSHNRGRRNSQRTGRRRKGKREKSKGKHWTPLTKLHIVETIKSGDSSLLRLKVVRTDTQEPRHPGRRYTQPRTQVIKSQTHGSISPVLLIDRNWCLWARDLEVNSSPLPPTNKRILTRLEISASQAILTGNNTPTSVAITLPCPGLP